MQFSASSGSDAYHAKCDAMSSSNGTFATKESKTFDGSNYRDYANNPLGSSDFTQSKSLPYTEIPAPEPEYCANRLPCGICMILGKMCPKIPVKYEITCQA